MKRFLALIPAFVAVAAFADPTLSVSRVQQRYPWNGLVDIDYTVSGVTGDPVDWRIEFALSGTTNGVDFALTPVHFTAYAPCDLPVADGTYRVTWDSAKDGFLAQAEGVTATAKLIYEPVTARDAEYLIVDLPDDPNHAAACVVRCVRAAYPVTVFNCDTYKTEKLVLKRVRAGEFWMRAKSGNAYPGAVSSGTSRFRVRLTRDYHLAIFELTNEQSRRLCGKITGNVYEGKEAGYPNVPDLPLRPLSQVGWSATMSSDYSIAHLNARAVYHNLAFDGFDLPTEAQWEYACRAGTETAYFWGSSDALASDYCWSGANFDPSGYGKRPHPVGTKLPNPWGFYDMLGNVTEWVSDWQGTYPDYSADGVTEDWAGPAGGTKKISRGGSFSEYPTCGTTMNARGATDADGNYGREGGVRLMRYVP